MVAEAVLTMAVAGVLTATSHVADIVPVVLLLQMPAVLVWSRVRYRPGLRSVKITVASMWIAVLGFQLQPSASVWRDVATALMLVVPTCISWEIWGERLVRAVKRGRRRPPAPPVPISSRPRRAPARRGDQIRRAA